jgi:hypothetical protein
MSLSKLELPSITTEELIQIKLSIHNHSQINTANKSNIYFT